MPRSQALQRFVDAGLAAFSRHATDPRSRASVTRLATLLETPGPERDTAGSRLPVCRLLGPALEAGTDRAELAALASSFAAIEPRLHWNTKRCPDGSASDNFAGNHANGMILGPGGVEQRSDLWIGVTLMAPNVRYPDHDHPPEETYLVLSPGEFRQGDGGWFAPGVGGSFYNTPGIRHAMRSLDAPLLAFWALRVVGFCCKS